MLSRGYKRKTKGFIVANSKSTPESIGDEPWQIYNKFGMRAKVAVCESRKKGIAELLKLYPDLDLIVLDDSFQHRWVKPKISIMLMEYSRPVYNDKLLPLGRLRESAREINRADKIIVTKCPDNVSPIDLRLKTKELDVMKYQKIYFSSYSYESLKAVFPEEAKYSARLSSLNENDAVLLLTGIAHPRYFVRHFKNYPFRKKVEHFSDHHNFSREDLLKIEDKFRKMKGERKIIITTEKDAVRLLHNPYFPEELKPFVFYQPISVRMLQGVHGQEHNLIEDILEELKLRPLDLDGDYLHHDIEGLDDTQAEAERQFKEQSDDFDSQHDSEDFSMLQKTNPGANVFYDEEREAQDQDHGKDEEKDEDDDFISRRNRDFPPSAPVISNRGFLNHSEN